MRHQERAIPMTIVLNLPEDIAKELSAREGDLSRTALESLALEEYRTGNLSEEQVRRMLGLNSRRVVPYLRCAGYMGI